MSAENIVSVQLDENSTRYEYVLRFLNKVMIGLQDTFGFEDSVEVEVRDRDGNVIRREPLE